MSLIKDKTAEEAGRGYQILGAKKSADKPSGEVTPASPSGEVSKQ